MKASVNAAAPANPVEGERRREANVSFHLISCSFFSRRFCPARSPESRRRRDGAPRIGAAGDRSEWTADACPLVSRGTEEHQPRVMARLRRPARVAAAGGQPRRLLPTGPQRAGDHTPLSSLCSSCDLHRTPPSRTMFLTR